MGIRIQSFYDTENLMDYLDNKETSVPEILFMNLAFAGKNDLNLLSEIKTNFRLDQMIMAIYSDDASSELQEEIFLKGANIFMQQPDNYKDLKKILSEIMIINWQYHTSGLNKNNFIMKV